MEAGKAGGGQNEFQGLTGLLNAISSQSVICVGRRRGGLLKEFESEQLWAGYPEDGRLVYDTVFFFSFLFS